jgi:hypothetical protein
MNNRCKNCKLRLKGHNFQANLLKTVPMHLRPIFLCDNEAFVAQIINGSLRQRSLCPLDIWVLTFISVKDPLASKSAAETLDRLVEMGAADLLCNLFENSCYETRRELWLRMTEKHIERLYLLDAMFEKEALAPCSSEEHRQKLHLYQSCMLFANSASTAAFDDLY